MCLRRSLEMNRGAEKSKRLSDFLEDRGGGIRTRDLLVPNQALYQAKLRPVSRRAATLAHKEYLPNFIFIYLAHPFLKKQRARRGSTLVGFELRLDLLRYAKRPALPFPRGCAPSVRRTSKQYLPRSLVLSPIGFRSQAKSLA
jgi:hypothetical protein